MDNKIILKVEQFDYFKLDKRFSVFNISQNIVVFFDLESSPIIENHIHFDSLLHRFKEIDLEFNNLSDIDYSVDLENIINYYIPFLPDIQKEQFKFAKNSVLPEDKIIIDFLGYNGNIKKGFMFFKDISTYVVEYNESEIQDKHEEFFDSLFRFLKAKIKEDEYDELPYNPINPYENLDEDALAKIKEIQSQLYDLKQSGQLLFALPILKQILNTEVGSLTKSDLVIDEDFKILLPNFNKLEIQLSHLTKAVYVLFCNNPQGINIKELHQYKKELLDLYSNISYKLDYDKIQQSIEDLVRPESKSIYTHISRIKSAFCKQMDYEYAKDYIISGDVFGNDIKYISILKESFQSEKNENILSSGITNSFANLDNSELFDPNELDY